MGNNDRKHDIGRWDEENPPLKGTWDWGWVDQSLPGTQEMGITSHWAKKVDDDDPVWERISLISHGNEWK